MRMKAPTLELQLAGFQELSSFLEHHGGAEMRLDGEVARVEKRKFNRYGLEISAHRVIVWKKTGA